MKDKLKGDDMNFQQNNDDLVKDILQVIKTQAFTLEIVLFLYFYSNFIFSYKGMQAFQIPANCILNFPCSHLCCIVRACLSLAARLYFLPTANKCQAFKVQQRWLTRAAMNVQNLRA